MSKLSKYFTLFVISYTIPFALIHSVAYPLSLKNNPELDVNIYVEIHDYIKNKIIKIENDLLVSNKYDPFLVNKANDKIEGYCDILNYLDDIKDLNIDEIISYVDELILCNIDQIEILESMKHKKEDEISRLLNKNHSYVDVYNHLIKIKNHSTFPVFDNGIFNSIFIVTIAMSMMNQIFNV